MEFFRWTLSRKLISATGWLFDSAKFAWPCFFHSTPSISLHYSSRCSKEHEESAWLFVPHWGNWILTVIINRHTQRPEIYSNTHTYTHTQRTYGQSLVGEMSAFSDYLCLWAFCETADKMHTDFKMCYFVSDATSSHILFCPLQCASGNTSKLTAYKL